MRTVVVTGANRGIGLALCQQYATRGWTVIGACRESSPELEKAASQVVTKVDITTEGGRLRLLAAIEGKIDLLINNAGVWCDDALGDIDAERLMRAYVVNAVAPLLLTDLLLGKMADNAKVGLITSRMGSIADNGSGGRYGYRMSKAALNAAGKSLAIDLQRRGIAVAILHPGFVQTRMVGFAGHVSPEESATGLVQRLDELTLANSGTFWHAQGEVLPW